MTMKLTKEKAIKISNELWEFLEETGKRKEDWKGWAEYGRLTNLCPLCEYADRKVSKYRSSYLCAELRLCKNCPYYQRFGFCNDSRENPFPKWVGARTLQDCRKYAKLFLEQLRQL